MNHRELTDGRLRATLAWTGFAIAAWFALRQALPLSWRVPGSPPLYACGVAGLALLLVPAVFSVAKRSGRAANPIAWFNFHVGCSLAGMVLIAIHSGGYLRRPPALLLLALVALAGIGAWARLQGARTIASTFASKAPAFGTPDPLTRERMRQLIAEKRALLARIDATAREGTFSVNLPHFLRTPRLAFAYRRLAAEESRLLGTRQAVGFAQAWWRPLHMALAWIFLAGVLVHVVTVTFFAGYVASGGPITWWHLFAWGN